MMGFKMVKEFDEDKAFEQKLKGKMGWKCSCSLDILIKNVPSKKSSVKVAVRFLRPTEMLNIVLVAIKRDELFIDFYHIISIFFENPLL